MQIERGTLNTLLVNARPTLTPSRWLLWFRDPERNASVYCLCSALVAGSPTLIRFEEKDTPTALNGEVKLSPPGNWTLKIYEQTSTTNLNPANATRLVEERAIFVVGALEPESGWSGTGCQPGSGDDCEDATAILEDSEGAELDRQTVAAGEEVTLTAPDVTILQTDGNPALPIGTAVAGSQYPLPQTVLRYNNGAGTVTTQGYDTLSSDPDITPDLVIPARDLKDTDGNIVSASKVTLTDLIDDSVPGCPTLSAQISAGDTEDIATFITASGKRPGVLAELIPTVDLADTVAQVYDVMTPAQQDLFDVTVQLEDSAGDPIGSPDVYSAGTTTTKTAPDGTVNVVDHLAQPLGSTTVKSNGTATVVVSDWSGAYPVLNENTPTYNDEGDSTAGWTVTGGSMASSASVNRLTQASTAAAASASRAVTMPTANGDWALYARIRARRTTGDAQLLAIDGTGSERAFIYFNFNTTTSASQLGTISIRGTNAAGTNSNAVYATGVFMDTNWQDVCLLYNHARLSFSIYIRQTDGSWLFGAQVNGTFFGAQVRLLANNTTTVGSWIEYDFLTLVAPNIQSIGNSLEQGATLFSPVVASGLINGASTWQRWAPLYPALRNNLIVNKGVGGNTTAMVAARIAADCINMGAKLVILSACNNDLGAGISQAQRTTNTQTSISLCTAAGIPVVLHNATYSTSAFAGQPASLNYYRTWWKDYRPTLTGLSGSIDIMGGLKDPNGYADNLFTQSDNIHPNTTGYPRMGEWIAALPYA